MNQSSLERLLARVLSVGTWLGTAIIAAGLGLRCMAWGQVQSTQACMRMVSLGIALFILLPVLRVALMAVAFIRMRDLVFTAMATAVLVIIGLAACIGTPAG
jgi:uncharacterized membrane protein